MHVDAYRLSDLAEVDDLDLDASLADSVTVVEWGEGKVEGLAESRLEVTLRRSSAVERALRRDPHGPGAGRRRPLGRRRPRSLAAG